MNGRLFAYAPNLQAFESGGKSSKKLIMIGGLGDGLLACPYVPQLGTALEEAGWALVQALLRSSYSQFGWHTLDDDVADLESLITVLEREGASTIALCGHSTGAQICAHYVRKSKRQRVKAVILQAGISDREGEDRTLGLAAARGLPSDCFMPPQALWAPITAQRYLHLYDKGGLDDYFSSDLTDNELKEKLGCFGTNSVSALVCFSSKDEYVPKSVDKVKLVQRMCSAMASSTSSWGRAPSYVPLVLEHDADHGLTNEAAQRAFVTAVIDFLKRK